MARELDEPRKKFLMNVGDTVYLQGNAKKIRSKHSYVDATAHTNPDSINQFMSWHGMIVDKADLEANIVKGDSEPLTFKCGTHGMLLSQFWYEYPLEKAKEEGTNPPEGEDAEISATIFCFLMVEDHMVMVNHRVCTKVY